MKSSGIEICASSLLLLCVWECVSYGVNGGTDAGLVLLRVMPCVAAGVVSWAVFTACRGKAEAMAEGAVAVLLLYESVLGMLQLCGLRASGHIIYPMTGTFSNPGPYGGLLAVLVSITGVSAIRHSGDKGIAGRILCILTGVSAASGLILLPASMSRTAWCSFLAAGLLWLSGRKEVRGFVSGRKWVVPAAVLSLLVLSVLIFNMKRESAEGRLHIWKMEALAIADRPLYGYGPGNAMGAYGARQAEYFREADRPSSERKAAGCPEYPFNEYFRFGLECGVPGLVLSVLVMLAGIASLHRRGSSMAYGLTAWAVFAVASYPLSEEIPRYVLAVMLGAACADGGIGRRTLLIVPAVAVASIALIWTAPRMRERKDAEKRWQTERQFAAFGIDEGVADSLALLYDVLRDDYRYLYDYGHALHKSGMYAVSTEVLREGAAMSCDPMFHNIIGRNLEAEGRVEEACGEYLQSHYMVPSRIYPLYLLMRCRVRAGDNEGAVRVGREISRMEVNPKVLTMKSLRKEAMELQDSLLILMFAE